MRTPLLTLALLCSAVACSRAQAGDTSRAASGAMPDMRGMSMGDDSSSRAEVGVTAAMSRAMPGMSLHMTMTPPRPPAPGDSARAAHIVTTLRGAIAKYRDVNVALADGYKPFLPNVPQDVYHFTKRGNGIKAAFAFDPARPTSLLYKKTATGYALVGAMYTAPYRSSLDELNARVPLSIYRWHLHTNLCIPPRGEPGEWQAKQNGKPLFGPKGTIATRPACDAAGGTFFPHLFGWMVHITGGLKSYRRTRPDTTDRAGLKTDSPALSVVSGLVRL